MPKTKKKFRMRDKREVNLAPPEPEKRPKKDKVKTSKVQTSVQKSEVKKPGRPSKVEVPPTTVRTKKSSNPEVKTPKKPETTATPVKKQGRQRRVSNEELLKADSQSGRVALAAPRAVEYLEGLLTRSSVQQFRGRKEKPEIVLTTLEHQALTESLALLKQKITLQRDGVLRRQKN